MIDYWLCRVFRGIFVAALGVLVVGCSGGSPSSSDGATPTPPPPPPDPSIVSVSTAATELAEESPTPTRLTISLDTAQPSTVTAQLVFTGSASLGSDYTVDATEVTFAPGTTTRVISLQAYKDWLIETDEVITIDLGSIVGNASADDAEPIQIAIRDSGIRSPEKATEYFSYVSLDLSTYPWWVRIDYYIYNLGTGRLPAGFVEMTLSDEFRGSPLTPVRHHGRFVESDFIHNHFEIDFDEYDIEGNETYYVNIAFVLERDGPRARGISQWDTAFEMTGTRHVRVRCSHPTSPSADEVPDPLFEHQWSLRNTGQRAFAANGGTLGADINLGPVIDANSDYGDGVVVGVIDTGLEICHPDLRNNVEEGLSYNYTIEGHDHPYWTGADDTDPTNAVPLGDHGTSVAGIIAAEANNGIGLRGIAPNVKLRGINALTNQSRFSSALGFSSENPKSDDIDVFNMSFGTVLRSTLSDESGGFYGSAVTTLRDGRGPIYVKAAGNSYQGCRAISAHDLHNEVGCQSATADGNNNLPFLIVVGAFDAEDEHTVYASVGSNLWTVAPSGLWGLNNPAIVSTDQIGRDRGYDVIARRGLATAGLLNPDGNYISTFNGTSAAAPHVSGAVALMLGKNPELTWRDVRHVLANTARSIDPTISETVVVIDGIPIIMRHAWTTNAAGYRFHNFYGFGALDTAAALTYLDTYSADSLGTLHESDWIGRDFPTPLAIPDNSGQGAEAQLEVSTNATQANIESVLIDYEGTHEWSNDVLIRVTSPQGTESIIQAPLDNGVAVESFVNNTLSGRLLTNAFYGEHPDGTWVIKFIDVVEEHTGSIDNIAMKIIYGSHPA